MRDNGSEGVGEVEQVGPFRIYLGAAPGVGKTYAMPPRATAAEPSENSGHG